MTYLKTLQVLSKAIMLESKIAHEQGGKPTQEQNKLLHSAGSYPSMRTIQQIVSLISNPKSQTNVIITSSLEKSKSAIKSVKDHFSTSTPSTPKDVYTFVPKNNHSYVVSQEAKNVAISMCMLCVKADYAEMCVLTEAMNIVLKKYVQDSGLYARFSFADNVMTLDSVQAEDLKNSYKTWGICCDIISKGGLKDVDLEKAKVLALQAYEKNKDSELQEFLSRQNYDFRKRLLEIAEEDIGEACSEHLTPRDNRITGIVMVGPKEKDPTPPEQKK
jgi:hypothetical protein